MQPRTQQAPAGQIGMQPNEQMEASVGTSSMHVTQQLQQAPMSTPRDINSL
jgi:hypothetical protein